MFDLIKQEVDLVKYLEGRFDGVLASCGSNTFQFEDKECPFCGHKDCFKVKYDEENPIDNFFKCFSCGKHGDVITLKLELDASDELENMAQAARALAAEFKLEIPSDHSPIQEIFTLAAAYYHNQLMEVETRTFPKLRNFSPKGFQTAVRKHTEEGLKKFHVGWSDGGLIQYLEGLGIDPSLIAESGLANKKGKDFLPSEVFIYPHYVNGKVSHFTFKDPLKKLEYQIPNKDKLNGHIWYGQDSIRRSNDVLIVEGENDMISAWEGGWTGAILASIGTMSGDQVKWLVEALRGKDVVTCFDNDDAGQKYRDSLLKSSKSFHKLTQYIPVGYKDIDETLKKKNLPVDEILKMFTIFEVEESAGKHADLFAEDGAAGGSGGASVSEDADGRNPIVEHKGCYYHIKYKDGQPIPVKISNFVIKLRSVNISGQNREREIVIIREDGKHSSPTIVTSEVKVSLKPFKILIANAVDGSFYGSELDMGGIWELVYSAGGEMEVFQVTVAGRCEQFRGWALRDCFLTDSGEVLKADDNGVYWLGGSGKTGLKVVDLASSSSEDTEGADGNIPFMANVLPEDISLDWLKGNFYGYLASNFGSPGPALTCLGWLRACAFSNPIYNKLGFFPFLYIWSLFQQGKTTMCKWLLSIYGMSEQGYTTLSQLGSSVGMERKASYFASLPLCIDEIRNDATMTRHESKFRGWFNRSKRTLGVKDGFGVTEREVRSTFMFAGEDTFKDPALRSRCAVIRIGSEKRETTTSYRWLEEHVHLVSAIGLEWIKESIHTDQRAMLQEIQDMDAILINRGVQPRISKSWAIIYVSAKPIADKYFPEFELLEYMIEAALLAQAEIKDCDMVDEFFNKVEGMQVGERPIINSDHVLVEGDHIYLWFAEVFRLVEERNSSNRDDKFSRNAILKAIKEKPWCVSTDMRQEIGVSRIRRRCIKVKIADAPEAIQNIASFFTVR